MKMDELLGNIPYTVLQGSANTEVSGICWDSRRIKPGSLFICVKGRNIDRHDFAKQAVSDGAAALVVEHQVFRIPPDIPVIKVPDTRIALAEAASLLYGRPSESLKLIGVTGTNGKTSVTWFMEKLLRHGGKRPGIISTIENRIGEYRLNTIKINPTTPDPLELHASFSEMAAKGATHVIMEVTSSALAQSRVHGLGFDIGIFTNLTQDHLEEHGTMENYRNEKLKLFRMCRVGIINIDDSYAEDFIRGAACPVLTYGINKDADFMAEDISCFLDGTDFTLKYKGGRKRLHMKVPGLFNVYNMLAAVSVCVQHGFDINEIADWVESIEGVKGRFELISNPSNLSVIIDYAHSPDSLQNILSSVRKLTEKRVILVFGCGGNRDKTKRPIMGNIGGSTADYCIITSDNPRKEEPLSIINDI
ncbi:MAG: UDP-N-acetylmuramoyl-L-alanyl-D-glutamate--2,6-diaminopimelate ligase, partial [Bacillota bacterium]|nr:UDP-N-acetylmuramoyl-L-alanyl-D-glutamate--2,6-diaminopimelate ligase [Bacillota bacterium]